MQLSFENRDHKYITCNFLVHEDNMPNPTAKLASFLFKGRRLSQTSLELSSSRGVFGSRESERERREKEEREERK